MKTTREERRRLERKGIDRAELSRIIDYVVKQYSATLAKARRLLGDMDAQSFGITWR